MLACACTAVHSLQVYSYEILIAQCRSQQDISLNENELTAAMKLLDKRGSGYIEFDEFVDWWVNKVCTWLLPANMCEFQI